MTQLGVNIDHVATLRQLRGTPYPDLLEAARLAIGAGAHQITVHLREDRRHIQDADVRALRESLEVTLNLEMAVAPSIVKIALKVKPDWVCLVPEKRQEVTTEGGLDVKKNRKKIAQTIGALKAAGIRVSLFIEPSIRTVKLSHELGADAVELHTGRYCRVKQEPRKTLSQADRAMRELERIRKAAELARQLGLRAHAGHGFDDVNVRPVASLRGPDGQPLIQEFNIGHFIVCRAALVGMTQAVREMRQAIENFDEGRSS